MRVLFASYAEKTHFLSMVPLAWALRGAGHEVRVASQPALVDVITGAGLTAVPTGTDHSMWKIVDRFVKGRFAEINPEFAREMRSTSLPPFELAGLPACEVTWERIRDGYQEMIKTYKHANATMRDELVELARAWRPDLVIWEPMTYSAPIAAQAAGAAHARMPWCLDAFGMMRTRFLRQLAERPDTQRRDPLAEWLAAEASRFGGAFSEELATGHVTIEQFPTAVLLDTGLDTLPMRYVPYNGPSVVPRWLWEPPTKPRVALTLGVSPTEHYGGYSIGLQDVLDSLADLDIEIVATVGAEGKQRLERVPGNTRIVSFVPLNVLVPTCSAVVHHAGFGTVNTVSLHGRPQTTLPESDDAPLVSRRLQALGTGSTIRMREATGERIRESLLRLLAEPGFATRAARLREEMLAMPTPNDVVPELVRLAAQHSRAMPRDAPNASQQVGL